MLIAKTRVSNIFALALYFSMNGQFFMILFVVIVTFAPVGTYDGERVN